METGRYFRSEPEVLPGQRPITFWVPDAEAEELIAAAELAGRSLGSYIRARLFAPPATPAPRPPAVDPLVLTRLQRDLERVAADIHELLRWVDFGHSPLAEEFRAAFTEYRKVSAAIRQTLRRAKDRQRR
jgi:hypothetical protein